MDYFNSNSYMEEMSTFLSYLSVLCRIKLSLRSVATYVSYIRTFTYEKLYLFVCVNKHTSSSVALRTFLSSLNVNEGFLMLKVTCSFSCV